MLAAAHRTLRRNARGAALWSRAYSTEPSSALDKLSYYSQYNLNSITYEDLLAFGKPPLTEEQLISNGEKTRTRLLIGLAGRVQAHNSLPYLPATNPSLRKISDLYAQAFEDVAKVPVITNLQQNEQLCKSLDKMVDLHQDNIPILAGGFRECYRYLPETVVTSFLDQAIKNRISLRLLAEHHISLTQSHGGLLSYEIDPTIIVRNCAESVKDLCDATYGVAPQYTIQCDNDAKVHVIAGHLDYILTELLKNAFRATIEHNSPQQSTSGGMYEDNPDIFRFTDTPLAHLLSTDFPPVEITIGIVTDVLTIRIRDRGGGIPPENVKTVFNYSFTSVSELPSPDSDPDSPDGPNPPANIYGGVPPPSLTALNSSMGTLAGLGFGLPLSRIYAEYFGGSLDLVSIHNWGCDVYAVMRTARI